MINIVMSELSNSVGQATHPSQTGLRAVAVSDWPVTIFPRLPLADYNYKAGPHPPPPSETQSATGCFCCEFSDQVYFKEQLTKSCLIFWREKRASDHGEAGWRGRGRHDEVG